MIEVIGGLAVIAGIVFMTVMYFKTDAELYEAKQTIKLKNYEIKKQKEVIDEACRLMDCEVRYEIATPEDVSDIRFGDF